MHDFNIPHEHVLDEHEFLGCCKNCRRALEIIKPHVLAFHERIKDHTRETLAALSPEELYRLFQVLDDIAHLECGERLGELILTDTDIDRVLPAIRSYYATFFSLHEVHAAEALLTHSDNPWYVLQSFPLYPRYKMLIQNQAGMLPLSPGISLAFIGCGPLPLSLILLDRLYGVRSIGLDNDLESVSLARKITGRLGLDKRIKILHGDESSLWELEWDMVLVAALAEPKARIFGTLREIMERKGLAPVICRTYTGLRALLYRPVQPEDIEGFRIVRRVLPRERVNNTLLFLELE